MSSGIASARHRLDADAADRDGRLRACASTSIGTLEALAPALDRRTQASCPGLGCTIVHERREVGDGLRRRPRRCGRRVRSSARAAGLPGTILPISVGMVGYQKSNPRPGSKAPGSVSARRSPVELTRSSVRVAARAFLAAHAQFDRRAVHQAIEDREHGAFARRHGLAADRHDRVAGLQPGAAAIGSRP